LHQVRPQLAAVEHAPDGPQVGPERRIRLQRAAERLDRARLVAELALAQLAELVREGADTLLGLRGLELALERVGLCLARAPLLLLDQRVEDGRDVEWLGQRIELWRLRLGRRRL